MHLWVEDTQDHRGTFVDALCMNDDDDDELQDTEIHAVGRERGSQEDQQCTIEEYGSLCI